MAQGEQFSPRKKLTKKRTFSDWDQRDSEEKGSILGRILEASNNRY
jgi:hypothetical protein